MCPGPGWVDVRALGRSRTPAEPWGKSRGYPAPSRLAVRVPARPDSSGDPQNRGPRRLGSPPERAPRPPPGVTPVPRRQLAIDEDAPHALRELPRRLVGRAILDSGRIEHDEIRVGARSNDS